MKKNNKGFTLAELLIVVAIIAVLVAIAIPVFTNQLERSKEATDLSNIRAAYAEVVADYLGSGATTEKVASVNLVRQGTAGWVISDHNLWTRVNGKSAPVTVPDIGPNDKVQVKVSKGGTVTVEKKS